MDGIAVRTEPNNLLPTPAQSDKLIAQLGGVHIDPLQPLDAMFQPFIDKIRELGWRGDVTIMPRIYSQKPGHMDACISSIFLDRFQICGVASWADAESRIKDYVNERRG